MTSGVQRGHSREELHHSLQILQCKRRRGIPRLLCRTGPSCRPMPCPTPQLRPCCTPRLGLRGPSAARIAAWTGTRGGMESYMALCVFLESINPAVAYTIAELLLLPVQDVLHRGSFNMLRFSTLEKHKSEKIKSIIE